MVCFQVTNLRYVYHRRELSRFRSLVSEIDRLYNQYNQLKQQVNLHMPEHYQQVFARRISVDASLILPENDLLPAEQPYRKLLVELDGIR